MTAALPEPLKAWLRENAEEVVLVLDFLMKNPEYLGPIKRMATEGESK